MAKSNRQRSVDAAAAVWEPSLGELCEMRPRPSSPPLIIPDPANPGRNWPAGWMMRRVGKYEIARFHDGDAQARPRGAGGAVMRRGPGGPIVALTREGEPIPEMQTPEPKPANPEPTEV